MGEMVRPGGLGRGYGNGAGLSGLDTILPTALEIITRQIAAWRLRQAEAAIEKPFSRRASLALDRALLRAEALGVRRG